MRTLVMGAAALSLTSLAACESTRPPEPGQSTKVAATQRRFDQSFAGTTVERSERWSKTCVLSRAIAADSITRVTVSINTSGLCFAKSTCDAGSQTWCADTWELVGVRTWNEPDIGRAIITNQEPESWEAVSLTKENTTPVEWNAATRAIASGQISVKITPSRDERFTVPNVSVQVFYVE